MIGVSGGIARGLIEGTPPIYANSVDCGMFSSGTITAQRLGLRVVFPSLITAKFGLIIEPAWYSTTATFSEQADQGTWVFDSDVSEATEIEREFRLGVTTQSLDLALLGTYRVSDVLSVGLGPVIGYNFSQEVLQTDQILGPGDLSFADGQTMRTMIEGPQYTTRPLSIGLEVRASAVLPLSTRFSLLPEVQGRYNGLSTVREAEWQTLQFGGNLGILFRLAPQNYVPQAPLPPLADFPENPIPPPAPLENITALPTPMPPQLSAAIEVYGIIGETRQDQIRVHFREVDHCKAVYLAPTVAFAANSTDLPAQYQRTAQNTRPNLDSLNTLAPQTLQSHLLDVVGSRMQRNRMASIVLHPHNTNQKLGQQQAKRVQEFLVQHWSIDANRVSIATTLVQESDGAATVEITSPNTDIVAPVISHTLDRDFDAPIIKIKTSQEADAGVLAWSITLKNNKEEIASYSSTQAKDEGNTGINWSVLYGTKAVDSSRLSGTFIVEDSTGAQAIAESQTQLITLKSQIIEGHIVDLSTRTERYLFCLPSATNTEEIDSLSYQQIRSQFHKVVRGGAKIIMVAVDPQRTGEPKQNDIHKHFMSIRNQFEPTFITPDEAIAYLRTFSRCYPTNTTIDMRSFLLIEQPIE